MCQAKNLNDDRLIDALPVTITTGTATGSLSAVWTLVPSMSRIVVAGARRRPCDRADEDFLSGPYYLEIDVGRIPLQWLLVKSASTTLSSA